MHYKYVYMHIHKCIPFYPFDTFNNLKKNAHILHGNKSVPILNTLASNQKNVKYFRTVHLKMLILTSDIKTMQDILSFPSRWMGLLSNIHRQERPIEGRNIDGGFCTVDESNPCIVDTWITHTPRCVCQVLRDALNQLETGGKKTYIIET